MRPRQSPPTRPSRAPPSSPQTSGSLQTEPAEARGARQQRRREVPAGRRHSAVRAHCLPSHEEVIGAPVLRYKWRRPGGLRGASAAAGWRSTPH
eukprot:scaffold305326_cov28-Tisochrysis_lutea.AAC.1